MRYTTLLFDLDHTLFDFDASETAAFTATLASVGVDTSNGHRDVFTGINKALWVQVERGQLSPNQVRTLRFEQFIERLDIDADAHEMADHYITGLGANGDLFPGARELLEELSGQATLALVSNGIGEVARAKVERLDLERHFAAIVVSGEVGTAKPGTAIFDITFDQLGRPDKETGLMIGDSLTSDIAGGTNYGIDTCWYAPAPVSEPSITATYRIGSLADLPVIVKG